MVILEEIKLPHPLFPMCGILVPQWALNGMHRNTSQYKKEAEQNIWRLSVEEDREVTSRSFSAYRHPLDMVTSFKYLEQVISAVDNDWMAVFRNLAKTQAVWRRLTRIFIREGVAPRVYEFLFKSVVQSVLLLGAETGWSPLAWAGS